MHATEDPLVLDTIPFTLDRIAFEKEIRLDAYPELEREVDRYLSDAGGVVSPKAMVRIAYVENIDGKMVEIGGSRFVSGTLASNLAGIGRVFAYTATCGREIYEMDLALYDPFVSFWHDTFKTLALRFAVNYACDFVRREYGIERLSSMNPGSGDASVWPIAQQRPLFSLLGDTLAAVGVSLTESCLMVPDKSVSGVYFPSEKGYVNCQSCTREICPNRRAPYRGRSAS